jgi:hypothetical protein
MTTIVIVLGSGAVTQLASKPEAKESKTSKIVGEIDLDFMARNANMTDFSRQAFRKQTNEVTLYE